MDLIKSSYATVIKFGDLKQFQNKITSNKDNLINVVNLQENGMSLLDVSLSSRKFDISNFLLDNGASINVITKEGCNEFHFLASNINEEGALYIARRLLDKGVSIMQKEKRFGNSAFYTLCIEAFKKRDPDVLGFIVKCLENVQNIDDKNKMNISIRDLIMERGSEKMKEVVRLKWG